jgi:hypothetical protein
MTPVHVKRHVKLALFGCVRCGRFCFAPSSYELDHDVVLCACDAARYKTTTLRAPRHVQEYWDAQRPAVYSSYRRRLKRHALPSVYAQRVSGDALGWREGWRVISLDDEGVRDANLDGAAPTLSVGNPNSATKPSFQRQAASLLHACHSALISGLSLVAGVERENKGKAS